MHSMRRLLMIAVLLAVPCMAWAQGQTHRVVIHVDDPSREIMMEALHNATNLIDHYRSEHDTTAVEIVANGRGVTMFAKDLSPVAKEIAGIHAKYPEITFDACAIALTHTSEALNRKLEVLPPAHLVPSGAVRIVELEEQHYAYLKP